MPVIKIREETEQVVYPASGQSNAAVIPLFVTSVGIETRNEGNEETDGSYYYRADLKTKKFTKASEFEDFYKDFAIKDSFGVLVDKNYYMIRDLLNRGLEVWVKPVDLSSEELFPMFSRNNIKAVNKLLTNIFNWGDREEVSTVGDVTVFPREEYRTGNTIIGTKVGEGETVIKIFVKSIDEIDYHDLAKILNYLITEKGFYDELRDKTRFNFKFMTTGSYENVLPDSVDESGYNTSEVRKLIELCASLKDVDKDSGRGECFTLIDFRSDCTKENNEIYKAINSIGDGVFFDSDIEKWKFAACTYPWVIKHVRKETGVESNNTYIPMELTGSYAYLKAFADYITENPGLDYMAIAGYNRGTVGDSDDCTPVEDLGEIDMHLFQNDSFSNGYTIITKEDSISYDVLALTINPIIKCQDGMYRIWGNRVMLPLGKANGEQIYSDQVKDCNYFLNVRHLVSDIKKECYFASTRVSFEPNDDVTWFNFKSIVNPLLDNMVLNRGMEWYSWKRLPADAKGLMKAMLTIKPIEAVESFDITVFIRNTDEQ